MPPPCFPCFSIHGCDSFSTQNLIVIDVNAIINGAGSISCAGPPKLLGSTSSAGQKTWSNLAGQILGSGNSFSVETPGTYILTVKQTISPSKTCIESDTVTISSFDPPIQKLFFQTENPDSSNAATGSISVDSVAGGTPPFSFFWSNGTTTSSVDSLAAGKFWVVVADSLGCEKSFNFLLEMMALPAPLPDSLTETLDGIVVWPNPTEDGFARLIFSKTEVEKSGFLEVFAVDGRLLQTAFFEINEAEHLEIDLKTAQKGLFWLKIKLDGERVVFKKLVKI